MTLTRALSIAALSLLVACSGSDSTGDTSNNGANNGVNNGVNNGNNGVGVTYHGAARAVLARNCTSCHSSGGIGPFTMDYVAGEWESGTAWWASAAVEAVRNETMPPWQPKDGCRTIEHARNLPAEDRATLEAWADAGFPEGDPAGYTPPEPDENDGGEPTLLLDAGEAYTPNPQRPDDYRCLLLDHTFERDTFVTGSNVIPGDRATVHHVLVYRIDADDVAEAEARDAQDPGPGYTCYGGTGSSGGGPVAGWVPGTVPAMYPPGSAIVLPAGTRLVMQVHYNTLAVEGAPPADLTQIGLWTLPEGQVPDRQVVIAGFPDPSIRIDAGDPNSRHTREFNVPAGARIIGAAPHMHTLGTAIKSEIVHESGETSCVIDIPEWDFNWQQFYQFEPDQFLTTQSGDQHRLTCVYDNSPSNQPVINGEQIEPRDVRWGEGTLDEMCLGYLIVDYPYVRPPTAQCEEFPACVDSCSPDDTRCYLGCVQGSVPACSNCLVQQTAACAQRSCGAQLGGVTSCLNGCDGNLYECLLGDCLEPMTGLYRCQRPLLLDGACNEQLAACEVEF